MPDTRQAATAWPGNKVALPLMVFLVALLMMGYLIPDLADQTAAIIAALIGTGAGYMVPERESQFPHRQYRP